MFKTILRTVQGFFLFACAAIWIISFNWVYTLAVNTYNGNIPLFWGIVLTTVFFVVGLILSLKATQATIGLLRIDWRNIYYILFANRG